MKGVVLLFIVLVLSAGLSAQVLTCRQIQEPTDGTANSPYMEQVVQVRGIVTAVKPGSSFYIGDALSATDDGKWSGLLVFDSALSNTVLQGDMIRLTGTVKEISNVTQLRLITANYVESPGNPVPVSRVTTAVLPFNNSMSEAWEGVMVRFNNVKIKTSVNLFGQFQIADADVAGVADSKIDDFFYAHPSSEIVIGDVWHQIQGVVDYTTTDGFKVFPRNAADMIKVDDIFASKISIQGVKAALDETISVEVKTTKLLSAWNVTRYSMTLQLDASLVRFMGVDYSGTLTTSNPTVTVLGNAITITYNPTPATVMVAPEGENTLVKLLLEPRAYGVVPIVISSFTYNDNAITNFQNGSLSVIIDEFKAYMDVYTKDTSGRISEQNIFDPSQGQRIWIEYGTKGGFLARTLIRIYDAQGRLVSTPLNENFTGLTTVQQIDNFEWNGRDGAMNLLPPGLYYCHMEVANRKTGEIARTVQPIVIKSRLK